MADSSISKIYQFISDNYQNIEAWKEDVDQAYGNSDGTLVKTEARSFLLKNIDDWCGEDKSKANDLINKFWKSIDTIVTGKVGTTTISNKNALGMNELQDMENALQATKYVTNYINKNLYNNIQKLNLGSDDFVTCLEEIKDGLFENVIKQVKGKKENITEAEVFGILDKIQQKVVNKCVANAKANVVIAQSLPSVDNYSADEDKALQNIISGYVREVQTRPEQPTLSELAGEIDALVKAYADTANEDGKEISKENKKRLGSNYNPNAKLNDLQVAVLTNKIKEAISKSLADDETYNYSSSTIEGAISTYIQEQLKGKKVSEYTSIFKDIRKIADGFKNSKEYETVKKEKKDYDSAITNLKKYMTSAVCTNKKYTEAIKSVFGIDTVNKANVDKAIDELKTLAEVQEIDDKIKAEIKKIDDKLPDNFLSRIPDKIDIFQSSNVVYTDLPNNYGASYKTRDLHYSYSGDSVLTGTEYGESVTIKGQKLTGDYHPVIYIKDNDGNVLFTKEITVNVKKDSIADSEELKYNGKTFKELATSNEVILKCYSSGYKDSFYRTQSMAVQNIQKICDEIYTILLEAGYNSQKLSKVRNGVVSYFTAIINAIYDSRSSNGDHGFASISTKYQFNDESKDIATDFFQYTRYYDSDAKTNLLNCIEHEGVADPTKHSGVCMFEGYEGYNGFGIYISAAAVIQKFGELLGCL